MNENEPIGNINWLDQLHPSIKAADKIECEFKGCKDEAVFWFQLRCCGVLYTLCREHMGKFLFFVRMQEQLGVIWTCTKCQGEIDSTDFVTVPQPLREQS